MAKCARLSNQRATVECWGWLALRLARRSRLGSILPLRRSNTAGGQHREKPAATRCASICGHLGHPVKPGTQTFDMLPGNALKIEVATLTAVGMKQEPQRNSPSVKAKVATAASPRTQSRHAYREVLESAALRAAASLTAATWTKQRFLPRL
jgi:hypothetical protein